MPRRRAAAISTRLRKYERTVSNMKKKKTDLRQLITTMGRVLGYMIKSYKASFCIVALCTLLSALATLYGTLFLQTLIDDYIIPLTQAETPEFSPLCQRASHHDCRLCRGRSVLLCL